MEARSVGPSVTGSALEPRTDCSRFSRALECDGSGASEVAWEALIVRIESPEVLSNTWVDCDVAEEVSTGDELEAEAGGGGGCAFEKLSALLLEPQPHNEIDRVCCSDRRWRWCIRGVRGSRVSE
jgi:hypothetical protein